MSPHATAPPAAGLRHVLALAAGAALVGCGGSAPTAPEPVPRPPIPDVFLVSVDTLRADHVSAYGHPRRTTPFVDSLAAEGVRFSRAYSTTSWTAPALASMLTSSYPTRHGVGQGVQGRRGAWEVIPEDLPNLPELFHDHGWRTFGLTANFGLPAERGYGRGFDRYRCVGAVNLEVVREVATPWLAEMEHGGPWFFWLHLFDPHAPYLAREPWLGSTEPVPASRFAELDGLAANRIESVAGGLDAGRLDYLRALYDSEIRAVDDYLREIFESSPRVRNALVVFVADHGEEFLDHGGVLHGKTLHEEVIRIPFVLRFPDRRRGGTVDDRPASLVDVLPTLADAAGLAVPPGVAGQSLAGAAGANAPGGRALAAELMRGATLRAWITGRWKYVRRGADGSDEALYDLDADPGERRDLAPGNPARVARFRAEIEAFVVRSTPPGANAVTDITPEQADALRDLGYVQ